MTEMISAAVRRAIQEALASEMPSVCEFDDETSLLTLGADSLKLVNLAVALEEQLGLREFPMQRWADQESTRDGRRYTVGSLIETCCALLAADRQAMSGGTR